MNTLWKLECTAGYVVLVVASTALEAHRFGERSRALRGQIVTTVDVTDVYTDHDGFDEVIDSDTPALVCRWVPSMADPQLRLAGPRERPPRREPVPVT